MSKDTKEQTSFELLRSVNLKGRVEKKGKFSYLSWSDAIDELLKHDPSARWAFTSYPLPGQAGDFMVPYLQTPLGYFVEASVTAFGLTRAQLHPVLDDRNQPIKNPSTFDINKSHQRALVKCIALHGLGLYVYQGEDLPVDEEPPKVGRVIEAPPPKPGMITPDAKAKAKVWAEKHIGDMRACATFEAFLCLVDKEEARVKRLEGVEPEAHAAVVAAQRAESARLTGLSDGGGQ